MKIELVPINKLFNNVGQVKGLPKNPRIIKNDKYKKLLKSITEDPEMLELREVLAYDNKGELVVIGGNMRLKACQELGYKEMPTKIIPQDTPVDKLKRYAIKDNVAFGEWDWDDLGNEWDPFQLEEWGLDVPNSLDDEYTHKIGKVLYEPKETNHAVSDLWEPEMKFNEEIEKIQNEELKKMLYSRVHNFSTFNYAKIADYYAYQATAEEQRIMEKLALVLLDKDQLIEHGYSKIIESVVDEYNETNNGDEE